MDKIDVIRAWKDAAYRASLSPEQLARIPSNPAGLVELSDELLRAAGGAPGIPQTTAPTCTIFTEWSRCCR